MAAGGVRDPFSGSGDPGGQTGHRAIPGARAAHRSDRAEFPRAICRADIRFDPAPAPIRRLPVAPDVAGARIIAGGDGSHPSAPFLPQGLSIISRRGAEMNGKQRRLDPSTFPSPSRPLPATVAALRYARATHPPPPVGGSSRSPPAVHTVRRPSGKSACGSQRAGPDRSGSVSSRDRASGRNHPPASAIPCARWRETPSRPPRLPLGSATAATQSV